MRIEFSATEMGFADGLGGASNAAAGADYHYVLFGKQSDEQHPSNSGAYFEFDNQTNGTVNKVWKITVANDEVIFFLEDANTIVVRSKTSKENWAGFLHGIRETFDAAMVRWE